MGHTPQPQQIGDTQFTYTSLLSMVLPLDMPPFENILLPSVVNMILVSITFSLDLMKPC